MKASSFLTTAAVTGARAVAEGRRVSIAACRVARGAQRLARRPAWRRRWGEAPLSATCRDESCVHRRLSILRRVFGLAPFPLNLLPAAGPLQGVALNNRHKELVNDVVVMHLLAVLPFGAGTKTVVNRTAAAVSYGGPE